MLIWAVIVLAPVGSYLRDRGCETLTVQHKRWCIRAFAVALCSYVLVAFGFMVLPGIIEHSNNDAGVLLFVWFWLATTVLTLAGLIAGVTAKGWTRIASLMSSALMFAYIGFVLTHFYI